MSIAIEIARLQTAKNSLKASINAKTDSSHQIANETIDDYADFVDSIAVTGTFQSKTATPTTSSQTITADTGYAALSSVTINAVTSSIDNNITAGNIKKDISILGVTGTLEEGITPAGNINITNTNSVNVTNYATAQVVDSDLVASNIKKDVEILGITGTYEATSKEEQSKSVTITSNGTTTVSPDANKTLSSVTITTNVPNDYFNATSSESEPSIRDYIKNIPLINTSSLTNFAYFFAFCGALESIPQIVTSNGTNMFEMFEYCKSLTTIPLLNFQSCTDVSYAFVECENLTTLSGFQNLGQAYSTSKSANYSDYEIDLSESPSLTEQSLINVLNNLYDIATKGCNVQKCTLGSTNLAKLTSTAGQNALTQAANFGWTIS